MPEQGPLYYWQGCGRSRLGTTGARIIRSALTTLARQKLPTTPNGCLLPCPIRRYAAHFCIEKPASTASAAAAAAAGAAAAAANAIDVEYVAKMTQATKHRRQVAVSRQQRRILSVFQACKLGLLLLSQPSTLQLVLSVISLRRVDVGRDWRLRTDVLLQADFRKTYNNTPSCSFYITIDVVLTVNMQSLRVIPTALPIGGGALLNNAVRLSVPLGPLGPKRSVLGTSNLVHVKYYPLCVLLTFPFWVVGSKVKVTRSHWILPLRDWGNCKNFAGSAALVEGLRGYLYRTYTRVCSIYLQVNDMVSLRFFKLRFLL